MSTKAISFRNDIDKLIELDSEISKSSCTQNYIDSLTIVISNRVCLKREIIEYPIHKCTEIKFIFDIKLSGEYLKIRNRIEPSFSTVFAE